jgi:hypothetical protein
MYLREILKKIFITIPIVFVVTYAGYKLYPLLSGPVITLTSPQKGEEVDSVFTVTGKTLRADHVYIFDREIFIDKNGEFKETMIKNGLITYIKLRAVDRYGKSKTVESFVQ